MKGIERIRFENVPVGLRVSRLFFVLTDLTNVDPMYQYSLDFFKHIFAMTLRSADEAGVDKAKKEEKRNYWINEFTRRLYSNVSRSLFQKHTLLFSMLLCLKIMDENLLDEKGEGGLNIAELRFLMAGATQVEMTKPNPSGENGWLQDKSWLTILEMSSRFESFRGFDDQFAANLSHWEKIYNSPSPQNFKENPWPAPWGNDNALLLKKTIIMRALRPDKVIPMIQKIVKKQPELGKDYLTPPQSDLNALYADSKNNAAIIIVISPGADPMSEIDAFSA
jgi:dynein heavy chain